MVDTRLAWFAQECPAFFMVLIQTIQAWRTLNLAQIILLSAFMTHYFNRLVTGVGTFLLNLF